MRKKEEFARNLARAPPQKTSSCKTSDPDHCWGGVLDSLTTKAQMQGGQNCPIKHSPNSTCKSWSLISHRHCSVVTHSLRTSKCPTLFSCLTSSFEVPAFPRPRETSVFNQSAGRQEAWPACKHSLFSLSLSLLLFYVKTCCHIIAVCLRQNYPVKICVTMECILVFLHWRGTLFWHQCALYEKASYFSFFVRLFFVFSLLYSSLCKHCTKQKWMKTNDKNESLSGSCFPSRRLLTQSVKAFSHPLYLI